ncbi:MAG: tetratricopeptide repeat protein [Pseudomonadota bacterium]
MSNPHRLLLAGTLLALTGCASAPPEAETAPAAEPETAVETDTAVAQTTTPLPRVELSAGLLYKLLVAEFAAQEGHLRLSSDAYLKSAQESGDPRLARRATQAAVYARDTATALSAARLWVELEPRSIDARQSLAALLIRTDQADASLPHLERIIAFSPENQPGHGYLLVANLLARVDDPQQALQLMAELTADAPDNPHALYAHAQLANQHEENETAQQLLSRLLEQKPGHSDGLILQARVLHALGKEQDATDSLREALEQDPDNDQMRLTYARMLVDAQQLSEAREQFRILNRRLPDNTDVIYALGLLALEAGDMDDAEPHLLDLVRLGERDAEARFALGQIAESRQNRQDAIDWYSSVPHGDRYMEAQLKAAQLIADSQGIDAAVEHLRQLPLSSDAERIARYQVIAELYTVQERHEAALETYDEALEEFEGQPQLLYARALAAERNGRIDWLERDLKRVLEQDPDNAQALNALGYTLVDQTERHQEGLKYIQRAYELEPEDPAILDSMGWALYRLGRHQEALDYLQRAADKLQDAEIAAHLGEVLWVSGDQAAAREVWNEALEYDPDHRVLQQTLERFEP